MQTQGLLDDKAWEYVASEIQYFAVNESVRGYMAKRLQDGRKDGLPDDIIPFTGFPELFRKIPCKFRTKSFPVVLEKLEAIFKKLDSSLSQRQPDTGPGGDPAARQQAGSGKR